MRLIRIQPAGDSVSLMFEEFLGTDIPPYGILSHTWDKEEVSYDDFVAGRGPSLQGYAKIEGCAKKAHSHNLEYIWVDTCCIDKRSSAELTEAISSMYKWYERSEECYVHLADVPSKQWQQSRWFTRGWTIQELLAPDRVLFYDSSWQYLFVKHCQANALSEVTNISVYVLEERIRPQEHSVASRMAWASRRVTTRTEDMAYCLMGLFEVNMPLLYGEGVKAFRRLQEEIARQSNDESLMLWNSKSTDIFAGPFAPSPSCFNLARIARYSEASPIETNPLGVKLNVPLIAVDGERGVYAAILACGESRDYQSILVVEVKQSDGTSWNPKRFFRTHVDRVERISHTRENEARHPNRIRNAGLTPIVLLDINLTPATKSRPDHLMELPIPKQNLQGAKGDFVSRVSDGNYTYFYTKLQQGKLIGVLYDNGSCSVLLVIGLSSHGVPWCQLLKVPTTSQGQSRAASQLYSALQPQDFDQRNAEAACQVFNVACWLASDRRPRIVVSMDWHTHPMIP